MQYIHLVQFDIMKGAYLPFQLVTWGQKFVKEINCNIKEKQKIDVKKINNDDNIYKICSQRLTKFWEHIYISAYVYIGKPITKPLKYIYYTECDQIVRFDSRNTLSDILYVLNSTYWIISRRKSKDIRSAPEDYMGSLSIQRPCHCARSYHMNVPDSKYITYIPNT